MARARNQEKLFVFRASRLGKGILRHIEGVRLLACNHQERLIDQLHTILHIKRHELHKGFGGVDSRSVRMTVGEAVVFDAVSIEAVFGKLRHLGTELFIGGVGREESLIDNFPCDLLLPCIRCLL